MKREVLILIIAVAIGVTWYFFAHQRSTLRNFPPRSEKIVAFGDSLIYGIGSTPGNSLVSLLSKKSGREIVNLGVPGNTTADGLARIDSAIAETPGTVILLLGGNDFLKKVPEDDTFANLRQMIHTFQDRGIFVVLLGIQGGVIRDPFKDRFQDLAQETGSLYVSNVLEGLFGDPRYMSDPVHPNDAGYAKMAERVYREMRGYVW